MKFIRGGSWYNLRDYARAVYRHGFSPDYRDDGIGFRVVGVVRPPKRWTELSGETRKAMFELGGFEPAKGKKKGKEIMGLTVDWNGDVCKVWWKAEDLRKSAKAFEEVADLLERRDAR